MTVEQWLGKDNEIGRDIWHKKYQKYNESFDEWVDRIADGDNEIKRLILDKKFLPGGRIMSNIGLKNDKSTTSNCFSRGFIEDDYGDIMQAAVDIGKTFKAQGGQGLSLSKLRPKGTPIGDKYTSDGITFTFKNNKIDHGDIYVAFTPDEEIGKSIDKFDLSKFPAHFGYTVDGSSLGEVCYENFNAASITIEIEGISCHYGYAKDKLLTLYILQL